MKEGDGSMDNVAQPMLQRQSIVVYLRSFSGWSKNEQLRATHARHGAATGMNGLSTDCSTVFVRKRKCRA
jgi:hypothetical protein